VLVFAVFGPVRNFGFITWDDPRYVYQNPHVVTGLSWANVSWAFHMSSPYFHPVTWMSHMLDAQLFGLWPGGHHLMAVSLHTISTCLLFAFFFRATGAAGPSAFVAALFAIHPMRVESVAWVAERKDVLPALALMITLNLYLSYVRKPTRWRYALVTVPFLVGMLAKPILIPLPFALLALDLWPLGRLRVMSKTMWADARTLVIEKLPWIALSIGIVILNLSIQVQGLANNAALPLSQRLANVVVHYVQYLQMMVWPSWLNPLHPFARELPPWWVLGGAVLILVAISLVAIRTIATRPYIAAGWFWFLATLVPVVGWIQAGDQGMADRFSYGSQFGLYAIVAWGAIDLLRHTPAASRILSLAAAATLIAAALTAQNYLWNWRDGITIWRYSVAADPSSHRAHANLADALTAARRFGEAEPSYRMAIQMAPEVVDYHYYYGVALSDHRRQADAIAEFETVLKTKPNDARAHDALGLALIRSGRTDEALAHINESIRLDPALPSARINLFVALTRKGNTTGAFAAIDDALRLDPAQPQARSNRGALNLALGKIDEAVADLEAAQRLEPYSPERLVNLGKAYLRKGDTGAAGTAFDRALALDPATAEAFNGKGVILSEQGLHAAAIVEFTKALEIDPMFIDALSNRGRSYALSQKIDAAIRDFDEILRIDPSNASARTAANGLKGVGK